VFHSPHLSIHYILSIPSNPANPSPLSTKISHKRASRSASTCERIPQHLPSVQRALEARTSPPPETVGLFRTLLSTISSRATTSCISRSHRPISPPVPRLSKDQSLPEGLRQRIRIRPSQWSQSRKLAGSES
ncbi:hypothetical protein BJ508DRAFT_380291, partial [Ascobolus immersus RN42]